MMRREFSKRERILLLVLVVLILGLFYYLAVQKTIVATTKEAQLRIAEAESQLLIEEAKLEKLISMEAQLDEIKNNPDVSFAKIPDYDNIQLLMIELNNILAKSAGYNLNFSNVDFTQGLARRTINMSYQAQNYTIAKSILAELVNCKYKSLVGSIGLSGQDNLNNGAVSVQLDITFYEFYKE